MLTCMFCEQVPMSFSQLLSEGDTEAQQPTAASCSQLAPLTAPAQQHHGPHDVPTSLDTGASPAQSLHNVPASPDTGVLPAHKAFASQESGVQMPDCGQLIAASQDTGMQIRGDVLAHQSTEAQAAASPVSKQGTELQSRDCTAVRQSTEQQAGCDAAARHDVHATTEGGVNELSSSLDQGEWDLQGLDDLMWEEREDLGMDATSHPDM